jgi:hypothetical protein
MASTTTQRPRELNVYHVIGRGLSGWHGKGINVSSSGGGLEDAPWWAGGVQYGYLGSAVDGCLVYDASGPEVDVDAFCKFIISGPMVDPALAPGAVSRFTDRGTAARMAPGLEGAFGTIAALAASESYGGLDTVGVDVYRGLLRAVPGVKVGTVHAGVIAWDGGDVIRLRKAAR